jgi:hypothetical protein
MSFDISSNLREKQLGWLSPGEKLLWLGLFSGIGRYLIGTPAKGNLSCSTQGCIARYFNNCEYEFKFLSLCLWYRDEIKRSWDIGVH